MNNDNTSNTEERLMANKYELALWNCEQRVPEFVWSKVGSVSELTEELTHEHRHVVDYLLTNNINDCMIDGCRYSIELMY